MLDSDTLLQNLLYAATASESKPGQGGIIKPVNTRLVRSLSLDTISWIVNIRMMRSR